MSSTQIARQVSCAALLLVAGCTLWSREAPPPERPKPVTLRLFLASEQPQEGYEPRRDEAGRPLHVAKEPVLTEADVKAARVLRSDRRALVLIEFRPMAVGPLDELSQSHWGGRLAIEIDDRLVLSPVLTRRIRDGRIILDGDFSPQRAEQIARGLNAPHTMSIGHAP